MVTVTVPSFLNGPVRQGIISTEVMPLDLCAKCSLCSGYCQNAKEFSDFSIEIYPDMNIVLGAPRPLKNDRPHTIDPLSVVFSTMWQECIKSHKWKLLGACIFFSPFPTPESTHSSWDMSITKQPIRREDGMLFWVGVCMLELYSSLALTCKESTFVCWILPANFGDNDAYDAAASLGLSCNNSPLPVELSLQTLEKSMLLYGSLVSVVSFIGVRRMHGVVHRSVHRHVWCIGVVWWIGICMVHQHLLCPSLTHASVDKDNDIKNNTSANEMDA